MISSVKWLVEWLLAGSKLVASTACSHDSKFSLDERSVAVTASTLPSDDEITGRPFLRNIFRRPRNGCKNLRFFMSAIKRKIHIFNCNQTSASDVIRIVFSYVNIHQTTTRFVDLQQWFRRQIRVVKNVNWANVLVVYEYSVKSFRVKYQFTFTYIRECVIVYVRAVSRRLTATSKRNTPLLRITRNCLVSKLTASIWQMTTFKITFIRYSKIVSRIARSS